MAEFADLVARTAGAQPWRRLFHVVNGLVVAAALTVAAVPPERATWGLGAILAGLLFVDLVRLRVGRANELFYRAFPVLLSPRDARGPASSTWYVLGVLIAVAAFPLPAAVSGILVLAIADPVASYLGRRWGRRRFLGGSVEGTLAFLLVALVVLSLRHPLRVALPAAVVVTMAERVSWPLDDNLTVPIVGAASVLALGRFL